MKFTWEVLVYFLALLCFAIAVFNPPQVKISLIALGLALWVLVVFLTAAGAT